MVPHRSCIELSSREKSKTQEKWKERKESFPTLYARGGKKNSKRLCGHKWKKYLLSIVFSLSKLRNMANRKTQLFPVLYLCQIESARFQSRNEMVAVLAVNLEKSDLTINNLLVSSHLLDPVSTNSCRRQWNSLISNFLRFLLVKNFKDFVASSQTSLIVAPD